MDKKLRFLEIPVIARRAHFSLASSKVPVGACDLGKNLVYECSLGNFFEYEFIIHLSSYEGKSWAVLGHFDVNL